jgi:hypothetical protein
MTIYQVEIQIASSSLYMLYITAKVLNCQNVKTEETRRKKTIGIKFMKTYQEMKQMKLFRVYQQSLNC